jgi:hypothetical protein
MPKKVNYDGGLCTDTKCVATGSFPTQYYVDIPVEKSVISNAIEKKIENINDLLSDLGQSRAADYGLKNRQDREIQERNIFNNYIITDNYKIIYNTESKKFYLNNSEISDEDKLFIKEVLLPYIKSITPKWRLLGNNTIRNEYLNIQKLLQVILDQSTYDSIYHQKDNKYNITFSKTIVSMEEYKEPAAAEAAAEQPLSEGGAKRKAKPASAKKETKPKAKPASAKKETKPKAKPISAKKETKSKPTSAKKETSAKPKTKKEKSNKI